MFSYYLINAVLRKKIFFFNIFSNNSSFDNILKNDPSSIHTRSSDTSKFDKNNAGDIFINSRSMFLKKNKKVSAIFRKLSFNLWNIVFQIRLTGVLGICLLEMRIRIKTKPKNFWQVLLANMFFSGHAKSQTPLIILLTFQVILSGCS